MNVLIVHAHPEPASFNGALTAAAREALLAGGHDVRVSDLYAQGFDPVSDRRNFVGSKDPAYFKQQVEEQHATANNSFSPDIARELDALFWCDTLIFQFPLWWFSMPAILKGWVDRVFASGKVYGGGRWYDKGTQAGKRAMCSVTIGGPASMYEPDGLAGDIHSILFHINHGIFAFTGFTAVEPYLVHAPARMSPEERAAAIRTYAERVVRIPELPTIAYPTLDRYDASFRLRK